jgi:hypothetical protein
MYRSTQIIESTGREPCGMDKHMTNAAFIAQLRQHVIPHGLSGSFAVSADPFPLSSVRKERHECLPPAHFSDVRFSLLLIHPQIKNKNKYSNLPGSNMGGPHPHEEQQARLIGRIANSVAKV